MLQTSNLLHEGIILTCTSWAIGSSARKGEVDFFHLGVFFPFLSGETLAYGQHAKISRLSKVFNCIRTWLVSTIKGQLSWYLLSVLFSVLYLGRERAGGG